MAIFNPLKQLTILSLALCDLRLYCHKDGHDSAGMVGSIEIFGPPPFTSP